MSVDHASDLHLPAMVRELPEVRPKRKRARPLGQGHTRVVEPPPEDRGLTMMERKVLIHHAMRNRDLTSFSLRVLGELDIPANPKNLCVWVSANTIAGTLGALPTTVHHSLKELEDRGYIVIQRDDCPCGKSGTHYRLAALLFDEEAYLDTTQSQDDVAKASAQLSKERQKEGARGAKTSNASAKASNASATTSTPYIEHIKEPSNEHGTSSPTVSTKPSETSVTAPRRKTKIPSDFSLNEKRRAYAEEQGVQPSEVADLFEDFRLYYLGNGTPWLDWELVWMRWVRESLKRTKQRQGWAPRKQGPSNGGSKTYEQALKPGAYDDMITDKRFHGLGAWTNDLGELKELFRTKHGHEYNTPCPTPCYTPPADYHQRGQW